MARVVHHVPMRWSDMDAYGHVNNTAYLAYLEQARIAMFAEHYDETFSTGTIIARHEIDYLRPIVYHSTPLRVETWIETIRGAAFTVGYEIFDGGVLAARARTSCVTYDFSIERPRRITDTERAILSGYTDQP